MTYAPTVAVPIAADDPSVSSMEDISAGDNAIRFARFVDSYRDAAVRIAWRLSGADQATAEEIAQESFARAHRALGSFRDEAALRTWFYRILVRQVANHRRWQVVRRVVAFHPRIDQEAQDERSPRGDPLLRAGIAAAMERLSERQRAVFVLVHLEGMTLDEAAHTLGCAPGTARSHLHRALVSLRRDLAHVLEEST